MADIEKPEPPAFKLPDPAVIGRSMADIAERSQRIVDRLAEAGSRMRGTRPIR